MKKSILTIAIASFLVACNSKPSEEIVSVKQSTDTAGMSEFQQWKNEKEFIPEGESVAFNTTAPKEEEEKVAPRVIYKSAPSAPAKRSVAKAAPVKRTPAVRQRTQRPVTNTNNSGGSGNNESTAGVGSGSEGTGAGSGSSLPSEAPQAEKKEGWSKAAKGTAIGGASGAVLGAIISKDKKGKGAIIGGVIGAAGGYVLGRAQDKKDGRY